jgi:phosphatidylglycerophosphatase A
MLPAVRETPAAAPAASRASAVAALVATGLGAGYAPLAPGTAGSLLGLALFWPLSHLGPTAQLAATAALFFAGVKSSTMLAARLGRKDPGLVVVDEVAGIWITLLLLPFTPAVAALGFLAFRALDVLKPYPARQLEALPRGWGIMCDDVMAGVYANLVVRIVLRAWAGA